MISIAAKISGQSINSSWGGGAAAAVVAATPLILAGLAVAVGFQAGLFNIGVNGQMMIGGMFGLWVAFSIELPAILHIPLAVGAAIIGGALWGGIPGLLRARTGAHEVITTTPSAAVSTS